MLSLRADIGLIGESTFCTEALKRDFGVSIVLGHSNPYDVITISPDGDDGRPQRMCRVQVKSCAKRSKAGYYQVNTSIEKYKPNSFDYYAFVIIERSCVYIIPRDQITTRTVMLDPDNTVKHHSGKTSTIIYLDRWDLLK